MKKIAIAVRASWFLAWFRACFFARGRPQRLRSSASALLLSALTSLSALPARASDPVVDALAGDFIAGLPSDWKSLAGSWQFFDLVSCFEAGGPCFGNNPSSPYGFPAFPGGAQIRMNPSEAVVIFLRTPPQVRYFGFTQYLVSRGLQLRPTLASMSRSLNNVRFSTLGTAPGGSAPYDSYAVLVWSADMATYASVKAMLLRQGIPEADVNFLPIPVQLPLRMGYTTDADVFTMLLRAALPEQQAAFDAYVADPPFRVFKVGPATPPAAQPAATIGYPSSISGVAEAAEMNDSVDALVADIKRRYRDRFVLKPQLIRLYLEIGLECIAGTQTCTMDNYDALYSTETSAPFLTVASLRDLVIIAGVNHRKTGKALYQNVTVQDPVTQSGVASVDDRQFSTESALFHAGVTNPNDPRVQRYANLFAYAIGYDCAGLLYCFEIPPPTPENPVGLQPGAPFGLLARAYVEPRTGVRPDPTETVRERVLLGSQRP